MQQAERFDFQENYARPGELRRGADPQPVKAPARVSGGISLKERKFLLLLAAVALLVGVLVIVSAAFTTTLNYQINELTVANEELEDDVAAVEIKIQTANSLTSLESRAKKELGMTYPVSSQIVYIDDITAPGDLASIVSEEANN